MMLDAMIRIAEAVLEELKNKQQNSPLAVAVIAAKHKFAKRTKITKVLYYSVIETTNKEKIMWLPLAEAVVVYATKEAVDRLMEK